MRHHRIAEVTSRLLTVMLLLLLLSPAAAAEEDGALGVQARERAVRQILGSGATDREKLAAADLLLAAGQIDDPEGTLDAALALLERAPATGLWLLRRTMDASFVPDAPLGRARTHVAKLLAKENGPTASRSAWAAAALALGDRSDATREVLLATWPAAPAVRAVLERELRVSLGERAAALEAAAAARTQALLAEQAEVQSALDEAARDDLPRMQEGMDALLGMGGKAVAVLVDEVAAAARGESPGRWPRAARAVTVLGLIGDRRATPALVRALDAPDGWIQVAAATALGDLGDPAATIPLAHKITYRGEVFRSRDQWDFPGEKETNVSAEAWPTVDYYVIDVAVADALIRLGVVRAIPWLIRKKMDPRVANFRIRVLQDAVDSLARSVPLAPVAAYEVDAGLPQRRAAFDGLMAWWQEQEAKDALLETRLDENDPGFRREARRMVEQLRGRAIFELQISHETCELLGPAITPTLLDVLATTKNAIYHVEIARALGAVDDARAIPALRDLMQARLGVVRATATESLGSYVESHPEVETALVSSLDDPEPSVRVAALRALVQAPPSETVRAALRAHDVARHEATFGTDDREYARALTVARLVQEGAAHWPAIREGLGDERRYERAAWWQLLNRALALPPLEYDPQPQPKTGQAPIDERDEAVVMAVLERRRSA